ncbi:hypothetical protein UPYG_G00030920 [Umbra pygmaea]|uniref:Cadherin domain-containing protein n=1 Tax=Umbra pygmaea TaxID=75934 RepID=A0ABD0XPQ8_UMBPY
MALGVFCYASLLLVLLHQPVQCCVPQYIRAQVPAEIKLGYVISQVPVARCQMKGQPLTSSDLHFSVMSDGTIVAVENTRVTAQGMSFLIRGMGKSGHHWTIEVRLSPNPEVPLRIPSNGVKSFGVERGPTEVLKRFKRRWSPPPLTIQENGLPPFPKDCEVVGSDSMVNHTVYYVIEGPGVTTTPEGLFSVDRRSGMIRVHYSVDREIYPKFVFKAHVYDIRTNQETDLPLDITVLVEDVNDNDPEFSGPLTYSVSEHCKTGTLIGQVLATDKDQEQTLHSKIRYKLLTGDQFFNIEPLSGLIRAKTTNLDRETQDLHHFLVEIKDMDGASDGRSRSATATVKLLDINDNPPTFRQTAYQATVQENQANVQVLRIPVDDRDEENTPNWNTKFVIMEGNENGNFEIKRDSKTNEGLLYLIKPLDYEKTKAVKLKISAQNEVPLVDPKASWLSVPVDVNVGNVDEGPEFATPNLIVRVKENTANGTVIATYTALDPETNSSKGIKYYTVSDPGSWINVDENTGELRVANTIDRESPLATNGKYVIKIKAVDATKKSGNGTVTLLIEDVNDNVPKIVPGTDMTMCEGTDGHMGSVTIKAEDPDLPPFSGPFHFSLPEGHDGKWRLTNIKNESAVLQQVVDMGRGVYQVPVQITDLQNKGGVHVLNVRVCSCLGGECVAKRSSVSVGIWGVLAMLLAFLLLLLLCLLCAFFCTTKGDKIYLDESGGGMLLKSNTEAPGEEVKSANMLAFSDTLDGSSKTGGHVGIMDQSKVGSAGQGILFGQNTLSNRDSMYQTKSRQDFHMGLQNGQQNGGGDFYNSTLLKQSQAYSTLSAMHTWKTNGLYLDKKVIYFTDVAKERYADDTIRAYGYEGAGSPAGSVGCCSDIGDQDNLDFLDSLGGKFKTLASICTEKKGKM